jgi:outer membrane protein TolC
LLQAKLDVERLGIQLKYDKNQLWPELDVFGTYGYNGSGKEFSSALGDLQGTDRPFYTYGGRISVPLSNVRARSNYKADKANMQQLVLALKQLEQNTLILIDNDIGTIRANYDQVQATRAAREYEEAALDAEQKKLESGKSTTYTVLQVQRDLTTARGNEIQALDTYNKSLSQLSCTRGQPWTVCRSVWKKGKGVISSRLCHAITLMFRQGAKPIEAGLAGLALNLAPLCALWYPMIVMTKSGAAPV